MSFLTTSFLYLVYSVFILILLYTLHCFTLLAKNYSNARSTGLPIIVVPFEGTALPWMFVHANFKAWLAPFRCFRVLSLTWSWQDNDKLHRELGESFVVVNTEQCVIHSNDPAVIDWVLARRKEFPKPKLYEGLDLFGKNVDTVNGQEWARHRKLTAPCFNERVSSFVWSESQRQSTSMLSTWLAHGSTRNITTMIDDTRIIALHVLYAAGFGTSHDFSSGKRVAEPGHELSHRDALMTILENLISSIILAGMKEQAEKWKAVLSQRLQKILLAIKEFEKYTDEAVAAERAALISGNGENKGNLMSTLIRTSDRARADGGKSGLSALTDEEIRGNYFIFNLAGHDTTANTLGYAIALLACNNDVQKWVVEELEEVFATGSEGYDEAFPRLKRVMAVFFETLRLYGPVGYMPRAVLTPGTALPTSSPTSTIVIPPNTGIALRTHALHTSATHYSNPTVWDPKRWITSSSSTSSSLENETLVPWGNTFFPFSSGPRVCLGMKMAQVEFAGVLSTVLRRVRVEPGGAVGEDLGIRKERLMGLVRESNNDGPALKITRSGEVCVRVEKR